MLLSACRSGATSCDTFLAEFKSHVIGFTVSRSSVVLLAHDSRGLLNLWNVYVERDQIR